VDIREGDVLMVSSTDYRIKSVADWNSHGFAGASFDDGLSVSASTKRPPAITGGKRGAAAEKLTGLSCTPLDPVTPELAHTAGLQSPHELLQTFLGDGTDFVHLVLEEIKTS
jgi:hypothetical protein